MATLRLYQSTPYPCSYLPERTAHHLISDANNLLSPKLYSSLIDAGFRRAGERIHRPNCYHCDQCISLRIPVTQFVANKSQRRLIKKNDDLITKVITKPVYQNYYPLYEQYITSRHPESETMQNVEDTFHNFLFSRWSQTFAVEFTLASINKLMCVAICDPLLQGWSAVYTFYNTEFINRSLGSYAILKQIELLQELGHAYLYLGYWVSECEKMNYKTRYKPCEGFIDEQWKPLNE